MSLLSSDENFPNKRIIDKALVECARIYAAYADIMSNGGKGELRYLDGEMTEQNLGSIGNLTRIEVIDFWYNNTPTGQKLDKYLKGLRSLPNRRKNNPEYSREELEIIRNFLRNLYSNEDDITFCMNKIIGLLPTGASITVGHSYGGTDISTPPSMERQFTI